MTLNNQFPCKKAHIVCVRPKMLTFPLNYTSDMEEKPLQCTCAFVILTSATVSPCIQMEHLNCKMIQILITHTKSVTFTICTHQHFIMNVSAEGLTSTGVLHD